jgi:hypothetical protein
MGAESRAEKRAGIRTKRKARWKLGTNVIHEKKTEERRELLVGGEQRGGHKEKSQIYQNRAEGCCKGIIKEIRGVRSGKI